MKAKTLLSVSVLGAAGASALLFVARSAAAAPPIVRIEPPSEPALAAVCAAALTAFDPAAGPAEPVPAGLPGMLAALPVLATEQDGVRGVELAVLQLQNDVLIVVRPYEVGRDQLASFSLPTLPTSGYLDHVFSSTTRRYVLRSVVADTLAAVIPCADLSGSGVAGHGFEAHVWGTDATGTVEFLSGQVDLHLH